MEDNVFWFLDHYTEYEVLVNIYVLLFLYCIGMIFLKFLSIIKSTKTTQRR